MSWIAWQAGKRKGGAHASASHLGPEMSWEVGYLTQDRSNPEEEAELELRVLAAQYNRIGRKAV